MDRENRTRRRQAEGWSSSRARAPWPTRDCHCGCASARAVLLGRELLQRLGQSKVHPRLAQRRPHRRSPARVVPSNHRLRWKE